MAVSDFVRITYRGLERNHHRARALTLVSFLLTWGFIRGITHLQKAGLMPDQHGSFHLHHMVPGIILLLISGYVGISFSSHVRLRLTCAVLYGIGAALTLDEFALWLFLKDVYWANQGRTSVDAVLFAIALLSVCFLISEAHDHSWVKRLVGKRASRPTARGG